LEKIAIYFWQQKLPPLKFGNENIHKPGLLKFLASNILLVIFMLSRISGIRPYRISGNWLLGKPDIRLAGYLTKSVSGASLKNTVLFAFGNNMLKFQLDPHSPVRLDPDPLK
jgi:hypothetical protein